ncbi:hypothetical protein BN13_30088 [Nostocoides jenkinsii Ben 74]|uniref:Uncharacterized protein n=1 Tax=Nostocoides jenkinsii Ben 74 TaxID=1193518 RepID=A0A077M756_9MICO|nr:hypothetical protein BN13_30088 [Tetrasphaera jenkinsii Ben 74]
MPLVTPAAAPTTPHTGSGAMFVRSDYVVLVGGAIAVVLAGGDALCRGGGSVALRLLGGGGHLACLARRAVGGAAG